MIDEAIWQRQLERERSARRQAETILEQKSAELYDANRSLESIRASLEETVQQRTADLETAVAELRVEIDRREDVERALIAARDEALASSEQKETFLAKVSHEIRTPLNSIVGFTRLLQAEGLSGVALEKLNAINASCDILLRMVNDLLTISRINADGVDLTIQQCDLPALLDETLSLVHLDAEAKGIELTMNLAPGLKRPLCLDTGRLQQVLINLVTNAVKYSEAGTVTVTARVAIDPELSLPRELQNADCNQRKRPGWKISVRDEGRGIAAESLATLFEPYTQVNSAAGEEAGSGLGLAICDKLCRLMGGEISVESSVAEGSTFSFWLPCFFSDADAPAMQSAQPTNEDRDTSVAAVRNMATRYPLKILTADDNQVNRTVLQGLLELLGYSTDIVSNGEEAVRAASAVDYDVILLDIRMPYMDGETAARLIREQHGDRPFIVAVTANAAAGERERLLAARLNEYLPKPVDLLALAAALKDAFAHTGRQPSPRQHCRSQRTVRKQPQGSSMVPSMASLNLDGLYERLGPATDSLLARVIPIFLRELPGRFERLETALASRDCENFGRICHALKGSSLSVGADPLAERCSELQSNAEAGLLPEPPPSTPCAISVSRVPRQLNLKLASLA